MPGKLTTARVNSSWELLEPVTITDADSKLVLRFDKGGRIICPNNKVPQRIDLELVDTVYCNPSDAVIIGQIYKLNAYSYASKYSSTPSTVIISPPARVVLSYDPDELPENTSSVFIAYYDKVRGLWIQLEPLSGFVAEVGKATAQLSHFAPFALIAK